MVPADPAPDLGLAADDDSFSSGLTQRLRIVQPFREGLDAAPRVRAELHRLAHGLADTLKLARSRESVPLAGLRASLKPLLRSLDADADGTAWLVATELRTRYVHRRAIEAAVHMAHFARRLRFDAEMIAELALGALLLDIGKVTVPVPILAKPGPLSEHERGFVNRHVTRGLHLLSNGEGCPGPLKEVLLGHHERLDGTGYPRGLRGTQIPLTARMAAIVDAYGAMTLDRHYARAQAPHEALRALHQAGARQFDGFLLREFIRALGVWPTGSWVRLLDGRAGLVRAQVPDEPAMPSVLLLAGPDDQPLAMPLLWQPRRADRIAQALDPARGPLRGDALEAALARSTVAA